MKKKLLIIALLTLIIAGIAGYIYYYNTSNAQVWFANTTVNGVDVSKKTLEESKEALLEAANSYELKIKGRNKGSLDIKGQDIDYKVSLPEKMDQVFDESHNQIVLPFSSQNYKLKTVVTYNKEKLSRIISNSEILNGSTQYEIVAPRGAYLSYVDSKRSFEVSDGIDGNTLDKKVLTDVVNQAVASSQESIDLNNKALYPNVYTKAKNVTSKEDLSKMIDACNEKAIRFINLKMTDKYTEVLGPQQIADMLVEKNGEVSLDNDKLRDWTEEIAKKYKTVGLTRTYTSHTGRKLSTSLGDYGYRLDYEGQVKMLKNALDKTISKEDTEKFIKSGSDESKKALTQDLSAKWYSTGVNLDLDNKSVDWDTQNYVEVDLGAQMVYVFRNGKVAWSCRTISGRPVADRKTREGAYYLKEHQKSRVLVGADYKTPVQYWTRITWTGTGFHGAPWQRWGAWSPSYYKSRGSHGCLNLTISDARTIYTMTKYKEMTFLHY